MVSSGRAARPPRHSGDVRRSSPECCSCERLSRPGEERERVHPHGCAVVDAVDRASAARLAGDDDVRAPASRSAATTSAPHSAYAVSVPARQTTGCPAYAASTASTPSVGPATSTAMPPAASRLLAKVARAVCAATGPSVARKTGAAAGSSRSASKAAP